MTYKKLTIEEVTAMRNEPQRTIKDLIDKYGVSRSTVYKCLNGQFVGRKIKISEETKEQIRQEPKQRLKVLAHKYNVSKSTICKIRVYGGKSGYCENT